jgi:CubicO group peptidase (beta-lactamase class C family)
MTTRPSRRRALACIGTALLPSSSWAAAADWAQPSGYPSGWSANRAWNDRDYRVGNYSGGFEGMFPVHAIAAPAAATRLLSISERTAAAVAPLAARAEAYMKAWPVTGLLIARRGTVLYEGYQLGRTPSMRMTSWSMAKSVTSLLMGICFDRGLLKSLDDRADAYVPELRGTLHGSVTLRNLGNMCSGAAIVHKRDNADIYPRAFSGRNPDLEKVVRGWNAAAEPQGTRWNYNELCPLTIGMVLRRVTGKSLAAFCQEALWQPLGAEADASWLCDAQGHEFNCIGFGARLRDWARLAQLVAQRGEIEGRRVVSAQWIDECASWTAVDEQVRLGRAQPRVGYKLFFWHGRADGSWMMMVGHDGQRVIVERTTQTVVVQTAVDESAAWVPEMNDLVREFSRVEPAG